VKNPSPVPPVKNRTGAERALHRLAALNDVIGHAVVVRDRRVAALHARAEIVITPAQYEMERIEAALRVWADANRMEEFGESKTLALQCGKLSYRTGQRKLELRAGWTWDTSLQALLEFPSSSMWAEYVRRSPEIDREKLLFDTADPGGGKFPPLPPAQLEKIGLKITREERFSAEGKPGSVLADVTTP
jgi:phage host-nuclease inhibitor protein Gam